MIDEPDAVATDDADTDADTDSDTEEALVEDVLVEEVSIDGMCGVY